MAKLQATLQVPGTRTQFQNHKDEPPRKRNHYIALDLFANQKDMAM
jgi:hypothetical protein